MQKAEVALDEARSRRDALWRWVTDQRVAVEGERRESEFLGRKIDDDARELERLPANDELRTLVAERRRAWEDSLALRETQKERWEVLGGERAEANLARERKALDALSTHASQLTAKAQDLTAHLRAREAIGLHEEMQEAEVAFTESKSNHVKLSRFAAAARCLVETLLAARREAQERLTAPVLERIRPYLDYVFPNSNVCINDEWTLEGLSTDDVSEPFAALSGGAQEQLGILVRLGLAELFADKERLPILLDDALINTDPCRLLAMQQALYQAADRLQIIVFSCQDTSFDALAPERIYQLHSSRRGA